MNSDPTDSATLKPFGMLDADELAALEEAMRGDPALGRVSHEMDRLCAAIAASLATPIKPAEGNLEPLLGRLNLHPTRRTGVGLTVSGWIAAAVLAVFLYFMRKDAETLGNTPRPVSVPPANAVAEPVAKVETKRLVQEIEVLRESLETFQHRDRVLFAASPGIALPIIMTMCPPGAVPDETPITAMLGDAVRLATEDFGEAGTEAPEVEFAEQASAIPIYDAARDSGTLVVRNLPFSEEGEVYNLWVMTETGSKPIYVGCLPESSASGADSFDFSLGSTMVLPSGFLLTKDPLNAPASPTEHNIVLQGPPPAHGE